MKHKENLILNAFYELIVNREERESPINIKRFKLENNKFFK